MAKKTIIIAIIIVLAGLLAFYGFFSLGSGSMVYISDDAVLARDRGEHLLNRRRHTTDRTQRAELLTKAIEEFNSALKLKPDFPVAYNMLGHCYMERGQWEDALKNLNKALDLRPDYPAAFFNRGKIYQRMSLGKRDQAYLDRAIVDYQKSLSSDLSVNFRGDLYKSLADAYHQKGDLGKSIEQLKTYLKRSPKANDATLIRRKIRGLTLMHKGKAPPLSAPLD